MGGGLIYLCFDHLVGCIQTGEDIQVLIDISQARRLPSYLECARLTYGLLHSNFFLVESTDEGVNLHKTLIISCIFPLVVAPLAIELLPNLHSASLCKSVHMYCICPLSDIAPVATRVLF